MIDYKEKGFDRYRELEFESDYIKIDHKNKVISPGFDIDDLLERGFLPKKTKVTFLNRNGYDCHLESAREAGIVEGQVLTVKSCHIGDWSSDYEFEEVPGRFNTVMFEKMSLQD